MNIRVKDRVFVISGKDKGKQGVVRNVDKCKSRALVTGVNFIKKHLKGKNIESDVGIISRENPIHISNLMLVCDKCGKSTRIKKEFLSDGKKVRVCKKCGEIVI